MSSKNSNRVNFYNNINTIKKDIINLMPIIETLIEPVENYNITDMVVKNQIQTELGKIDIILNSIPNIENEDFEFEGDTDDDKLRNARKIRRHLGHYVAKIKQLINLHRLQQEVKKLDEPQGGARKRKKRKSRKKSSKTKKKRKRRKKRKSKRRVKK